MKDDIKNLIKGVRTLHNDQAISMLCDELENSIQFNEDTLKIKIGLAEENQRLRTANEHLESMVGSCLEAAGEDWQDVDDLPNVIKRMRQELELKSASGYPVASSMGMVGIPPMSPECFRQNAVLAVVNGMLASGRWDNANELVSDALDSVDHLIRELAK
ncbi:hypothetical protein [Pseudomonas sp.]|uniref:hypothetical protein n=1 Tax=Pseudomonas sp. TaxID=306 RepID=UPI002583FD45|nr:hypothetical protein [Pseudomonas sp.]